MLKSSDTSTGLRNAISRLAFLVCAKEDPHLKFFPEQRWITFWCCYVAHRQQKQSDHTTLTILHDGRKRI